MVRRRRPSAAREYTCRPESPLACQVPPGGNQKTPWTVPRKSPPRLAGSGSRAGVTVAGSPVVLGGGEPPPALNGIGGDGVDEHAVDAGCAARPGPPTVIAAPERPLTEIALLHAGGGTEQRVSALRRIRPDLLGDASRHTHV